MHQSLIYRAGLGSNGSGRRLKNSRTAAAGHLRPLATYCRVDGVFSFPLSRCTSTIQIVRPSESTAETQPKVSTGCAELVCYDFPVFHSCKLVCDYCARHSVTGVTRNPKTDGYARNVTATDLESPSSQCRNRGLIQYLVPSALLYIHC